MKNLALIVRNEFANFKGNDPGFFAVYGIIVLIYSAVFTSNALQGGGEQSILWWIFFSVVATGSFLGSVFIVERLKGSFEILLTCGLARHSILLGKILYIVIMSLFMGLCPFALSLLWTALLDRSALTINWTGPILFVGASFMNATCASWLTLRLGNPRLVHFVNLLMLTFVVTVFYLFLLNVFVLFGVMILIGILFLFLGFRAFESEKIIQPINW
ncbi:MAG: hypothetical protein GF401_20865 [Chitinivibrionales bacterium]|nr:hypothetical protein [Chitinivibrionales bacterium]